ncbi:TM2 domain-containing protein [Melghirimyces algeriensis]|uniref:TM2 domain-containing protein n=1 Tax=Melghirimyces algeriensis TaxID=910412 RepID=A0A521EHG4_9BACL|nr:TM2 domain-containing protein [Melghirimyces algeriensis]SMO83358.1 TM2 domain-containing protein [Melghirimyces algeriensis]
MDNILLKRDLTGEQLSMVHSELERRKKSKGVLYLMWFFLGLIGGHRFYLGDIGLGVAMLFFGWLTFGIWPFIDVFFIGSRLEKKTEMLEREIIQGVMVATKQKPSA